MIASNYISELLKIQLESRGRNFLTQGTGSGFISTHAETTQKSIRSKVCMCMHNEVRGCAEIFPNIPCPSLDRNRS